VQLTVERLDAGSYRVTGGAEPHRVTVTASGCWCDCEDFRYRRELRGETCKHIAAVVGFQESQGAAAPADLGVPLVDGSGNGGPGLEEVPPPQDLEAGEDVTTAEAGDPVVDALRRSGIADLRAPPSDGALRAALYRLAEEAMTLDVIDRILLDSEATLQLAALGVEQAGRLVTAAIHVGQKAIAAAAAPDALHAPPPGEATRPPAEAPSLLLRSLAELLEDPDALKPPMAVAPRLAFRGRVTLLVGREKLGGKSTLLTAAAAAVTRGADFLGEPCAAGDVLWVTADQEHANEITQRAVRFAADPARFHVLWPHAPFADLQAALERVQPVLLIVDTLASFARTVVSDPHSSAEWPAVLLPLLTAAREREMAVAIAHHAKKNEGGGYRDSTAIGALVDMLLELLPDTGNAARRNVTALGRWPASNFAVELVEDHYQVVASGALSLDAQILALIQAKPRASQSAVRAVGGRHDDVDRALGRLLASGAVRNDGTDRRHAYVAAAPAPELPLDESDPDAPPF
jgi:hypothetical protein